MTPNDGLIIAVGKRIRVRNITRGKIEAALCFMGLIWVTDLGEGSTSKNSCGLICDPILVVLEVDTVVVFYQLRHFFGFGCLKPGILNFGVVLEAEGFQEQK